jgi:ATP-dependent DNA helicase RecG
MKVAKEYTVCFANADGGVVIFGVADRTKDRAAAIHGVRGYDLDVWRREIYAATTPGIQAEVEELPIPEGSGKLLIVRIPKGQSPPYGTAQGLFKRRIGKNCMPLDAAGFLSARVSTGAVDWSGHSANEVSAKSLHIGIGTDSSFRYINL